MSGTHSPILFAPDAYDVIVAAMNESERGRLFLEEHARRSRGPDTATLLDALGRIESAVTAQRQAEDVGHLRGSLLDMANAISRTKAEIAAISAPEQDLSRLGGASEALDAIVRTTERATSDILGAAEAVQEAAWTLRERGVDEEVCDRLDRHATQIYTACSFQDLTAQRTGRIVGTLRYLEDRLSAMIAIWDGPEGRVPPGPDAASRAASVPVDLSQSDVDRFIDMGAPEPEAALTPIVLDEAIDFLPAMDPEAAPGDPADAEPVLPEVGPAAPDPAEADLAFAAPEPAASEPEPAVGDDFDLTFEEAAEDLVEAPVEAPVEGAVEETAAEITEAPAPEPAAESAPAASEPPAKRRAQAELDLGDIDLLSIEEKLALFS